MSKILLKKILRDLYARKVSIAALILIASIGTGSFVGMSMIYRDLDRSREKYYEQYRLADFVLNMKRGPENTVSQAADFPNIIETRGRISKSVLIQLPHSKEPVTGSALSMPEVRGRVLNNIMLKTGTWFSGTDDQEIIVNHAFAEENGIRPGDRLKITLLDKQHDLLVLGTAMSPEFVYLIPESGGFMPDPARFGVVYFTEDFLQKSCDLNGAWNQIIGVCEDSSLPAVRNSLDMLERKFDQYGVTGSSPVAEQASVKYLADELHGIKVTSRILPVIFLFVAALVLNIVMNRMVAQQRSIIGTLKALGAGSGAIRIHYLLYGIIIGGAGGAGGILLGRLIQYLMIVKVYPDFFALPNLRTHLYLDVPAVSIIIGVVFAASGTWKGVKYASKLSPAEAMRPNPPEKGGGILPEKIGFLWNPLPFRWKMVMRAVFRNPFRSSVTVIAAAIATAILLSSLSNMAALQYMMHYQYEKISHEDVTINLRNPEGRRVKSELRNLGMIEASESQLAVACDFRNGIYQKRVGVRGLTEDHYLFTPLDIHGRPVRIPESGVILSRKLAEILHVKIGDTLRIRPLIGERRETEVVVEGLVETYLGLSAYAGIEYLSRLIGEEWAANTVLANLEGGRAGEGFYDSIQKRPAVIGVNRRKRSLELLNKTFGETMGAMISVMIFIAGAIAFGSVLNTAMVSLSERKREVGTLRVLGYTPWQITKIFSWESNFLNFFGIILGLFGGIGLSHLIAKAYSTELYRFPAVIPADNLWISALLMFGFVSLAQLGIYFMIRRFKWLDVLKVKE